MFLIRNQIIKVISKSVTSVAQSLNFLQSFILLVRVKRVVFVIKEHSFYGALDFYMLLKPLNLRQLQCSLNTARISLLFVLPLDESMHLACAYCMKSMMLYSPDTAYHYHSMILPLVFVAKHDEEKSKSENM